MGKLLPQQIHSLTNAAICSFQTDDIKGLDL